MNQYDDLQFPNRIEPMPYLLIIGIVLMLGAVSFTSNTLSDRKHKEAHEAVNAQVIAEAATHCDPGTKITIIEGGRKTCIKELTRTYAASDRRIATIANKPL